jgi:phosphohistidine phosphatase
VTSTGPTSLELYLVRHAVAALRGPEYPDDAVRPLTPEGIDKCRHAVMGLRELGVALDLVLTSPYTRAQETASLVAAGLRPKPRVTVVEALAPGHRPAQVMAAVESHAQAGRNVSRIALVGHEPDLGELAARLLGAKGVIAFKKGAVCRIDVDRAMPLGPGTLRWFLPPRALRGLVP